MPNNHMRNCTLLYLRCQYEFCARTDAEAEQSAHLWTYPDRFLRGGDGADEDRQRKADAYRVVPDNHVGSAHPFGQAEV